MAGSPCPRGQARRKFVEIYRWLKTRPRTAAMFVLCTRQAVPCHGQAVYPIGEFVDTKTQSVSLVPSPRTSRVADKRPLEDLLAVMICACLPGASLCPTVLLNAGCYELVPPGKRPTIRQSSEIDSDASVDPLSSDLVVATAACGSSAMVRKTARSLPLSLAPRDFSRVQAAEYIGVGVTKFDEMVDDGRMPRPKRIDGRSGVVPAQARRSV